MGTATKMFRNHPLVSGLSLLSLSVLFALFCAEAFLRLINYSPDKLALFQENPNGTGSYRLRPNLDMNVKFGTKLVHIRTNAYGMRWREVSLSKHAGTKRVAFIGDSFTFGLWADSVEQSLVGVFDTLLAPNGVETLNFGVPGYGLADIELLIHEQVLRFRPDIIILLLYNGNDFLDTYLGLERYYLSGDGVLLTNEKILKQKIPEEFRRGARSLQRSLTDQIYLTRLLKTGLLTLLPQDKSKKPQTTPRDNSYTSNLFWSQTDYPEFALKAKDMTFEALERIVLLLRKNQVELCIAAIPSIQQVLSPEKFGDDFHLDLPQRYLAEFTATNAIPFLDLLPGLALFAREPGEDVYYLGDGHFNNLGHRVVGNLLASFFAKQAEAALPQPE